MKTSTSLLLLVLVCSSCAGGPLPADHTLSEVQQEELQEAKKKWAAGARASLLRHHGAADRDGDGQLSAADLAAHAAELATAGAAGEKARGGQLASLQEFFGAADKDKDGTVTTQEFVESFLAANDGKAAKGKAGGSAGKGGGGSEPSSAADRERLSEHAARKWERLAQGKAKLSTAEAAEAQYEYRHGYRGAADTLLQRADHSGDGKLSLSEMQKVQLDEVPHELLVLLTSHDPRVEL
jgi:hypothetical protein